MRDAASPSKANFPGGMKMDEGKDDGDEPKNDTAVVCVFF